MPTTSCRPLCVLAATLVLGLGGCGSKKPDAPAGGDTSVAATHHHHHGSAQGPHGGNIVGFDTEKYHAEVTLDAPANRVGVYILGNDAATASPIEATSVTINVKEYDKPTQYVLNAAAQPDDGAGRSSYFELVSEPLAAVVSGHSEDPNAEISVNFTADEMPQVGYLDTHLAGPGMAHGHSHAEGADTLIWLKEEKEQGYDIAIGHHGVALLAGSKVEPAVQITHDGKPVEDAKVFNTLLAEDGQSVLAEEVATVYEPPTDEEPSHYAQGSLEIPSGTRNVVIRYRIVFPEGKGEKTYDVPVGVK